MRRRRPNKIQELREQRKQRERAKGFSGNGVRCSQIITIGRPVLGEPIEKKLPKKHLDQALDNAIVLGDFERVKKLVEQDGAKATWKHLKTAVDVKEEKIAAYLKAEIKRRSESTVSMPPEEGWDEL